MPAPFFPSGAKVGAVSKPGTKAFPFWMLLWVASRHRQLLRGHVPPAHTARGALNGISEIFLFKLYIHMARSSLSPLTHSRLAAGMDLSATAFNHLPDN